MKNNSFLCSQIYFVQFNFLLKKSLQTHRKILVHSLIEIRNKTSTKTLRYRNEIRTKYEKNRSVIGTYMRKITYRKDLQSTL